LQRPECARRGEPLASLCTDYNEEAAALSASASGTVGPCGHVVNDTPHGWHDGAKCEWYQMHGIVGQRTLGGTSWLL